MNTVPNTSKALPFLAFSVAIVTCFLAGTRAAQAQANVKVVYSFPNDGVDGANPIGGLLQAADGTIYGTTSHGGLGNLGTIFQMPPDGSSYTFCTASQEVRLTDQ